jgi:hypothetical protein
MAVIPQLARSLDWRGNVAFNRFSNVVIAVCCGIMTGKGPAGRTADTLTLVTSSRSHPFLQIRSNTILNERVHTFPDAIDLGPISAAILKAHRKAHPEELQALTKQVMVYQEGGNDFRISAATDVPFLHASTSLAQLKDRYEVRLSVVPERLKAGPTTGVLVIDTNDPEFPRLTIPSPPPSKTVGRAADPN